MTINWALIGVLVTTVAGGVAIGLLAAPTVRSRKRKTFVVVRSWFQPEGLEILYSARSLKAAQRWRIENRAQFGAEGNTLYVYDTDYVNDYNARAMRTAKFWRAINSLGEAWERLQEAEGIIETLQAELARRELTLPADPAVTIDLQERIHDTAELLLAEVRRLATETPFHGVPVRVVEALQEQEDRAEPGSVMPQFDPTEAMSLDAVASAANALPVPPAAAPHVVLKPTSKPSTQTVVIDMGTGRTTRVTPSQ